MKFRSPTEKSIFLADTSGHTCIVGPDLVEVPARFQRMAVAEGCLPEGVDRFDDDNATDPTKAELITKAIQAMQADPVPGDFTADGRPNVGRVSAKAGFTVSAGERDAAWNALTGAEDGED